MRLEPTSISCGLARLVIPSRTKPTQAKFDEIIAKQAYYAMMYANVDAKRTGVIKFLKANGFRAVKKPAAIKSVFLVRDISVKEIKKIASRFSLGYDTDE